MMEDMLLVNAHAQNDEFVLVAEISTTEICTGNQDKLSSNDYKSDSAHKIESIASISKNINNMHDKLTNIKHEPHQSRTFHDNILLFYEKRALIFGIILGLIFYFFQIPQFLQGVLACLFCFILFSNLYDVFMIFVNKFIINSGSNTDSNKFEIPDYSKMPICEIPAAEEHKVLKTYSVSCTSWISLNYIN